MRMNPPVQKKSGLPVLKPSARFEISQNYLVYFTSLISIPIAAATPFP